MRRRSFETITPPILDRPAPTTRRTRETSRWDRLFHWVLRPGWGYRFEALVVVVILVCYQALTHRLGAGPTAVIAGGWVAIAALHPVARATLARYCHAWRLQRRWGAAVRHAALATPNDRVPRPIAWRPTPAGDHLVIKIPAGSTISAVAQRAEAIAAYLGVRAIRVIPDDHNAAVAQVGVITRDPLAEAEPIPRPETGSSSLWEPIPVGIDEMGDVVSLSLIGRNLLVGGEPEAGKSSVLQLIVAHAALDAGADLALLDPKSVELRSWSACATHYVEDDLDHAIEVLAQLREEMGRRYRFLAERSKRKIEPGDGFHPMLVVVDELASYLDVEAPRVKAAKAFQVALTDVVRRGRAAGIIVVAATQRPSTDIIAGSLRDLISYRWALRCPTREASDTILGTGWAARGFTASDIDPAARGLGYLRHRGPEPIRLKAFYIGDEALGRLVARAQVLRRPAEAPSPLYLVEDNEEEAS